MKNQNQNQKNENLAKLKDSIPFIIASLLIIGMAVITIINRNNLNY